MKTQIVTRLSKKYFLPNLPNFKVKGSLIYQQDIQYLLSGFSFESSAVDRNLFTIYVFVQPLYIPCSYLFFTFGRRLGFLCDNHDIWWKYDELHEEELANEILYKMLNYGVPYLEQRKDLDRFIHCYDKIHIEDNPNIIEGIGYACLLADQYQHSIFLLSLLENILDKRIKENPTITWYIEMQKRVQLILGDMENHDLKMAKQRFDQWRGITLTNLGI